jgi:hypothetical protein
MTRQYNPDMENSHWSLSLDVASANALVWFASFGREVELTREAHLYFFDRYSRLAAYHRARGHAAKTRRFEAKADEHRLDNGDPPFAAAMAMPRPRAFVYTDAVSRRRLDGPDDAA